MQILPETTITTAVTGAVSGTFEVDNCVGVAVVFDFVRGSGGTTAKAWLQTSVDGTEEWVDVIGFSATTASLKKIGATSSYEAHTHATIVDGTTGNATIVGFLGNKWRVKYTTTGTYAASTTLEVNVDFKSLDDNR